MADHRHKRDTDARILGPLTRARATTVAASLAVLATASAVSYGVLSAEPAAPPAAVAGPTVGDALTQLPDLAGEGRTTLSRGAARTGPSTEEEPQQRRKPMTRVERITAPEAKLAAIRQADTRMWTTEVLNLWTTPADGARQTGELEAGKRVTLTGRSLMGRDEIVWGKKQTRWVTSGYFSEEEPVALGGECTNGTSVPSSVSPNIIAIHQAVCAAWPEISTYGTLRSDGEHSQGLAIDIMVSGPTGWEIAEFLQEHYADLGVNYIIYEQQIWSVDRSGEGWRGMENRGSVTANHYDHVHVTVY